MIPPAPNVRKDLFLTEAEDAEVVQLLVPTAKHTTFFHALSVPKDSS